MIYFCDSLVAFVVEIFNKFHVISCLWYESDEKVEQKFMTSIFQM